MALHIVIIGAGIGGLVAATSLRQAGHKVIVIEKHSISGVVGAAIHVPANAVRILERLGFDQVRARVCVMRRLNIMRGSDLNLLDSTPLAAAPGQPKPFSVHRADLHMELLRLATTEEGNVASWGPPVEIRAGLGARQVAEDGMGVILTDGEELHGDLIVGADGVHSVIRDYVVQGPQKVTHTGMAAFRFLLETDKMRHDEELAPILQASKRCLNMLPDTTETERERHIMWYECQGGEQQNFVGIHPSTSTIIENASDELKEAMKTDFGHYDAKVRKIISLSKHIKRWPLYVHEPLPKLHRGHILLIGDAAHPMLPFSGQGAAQAMEDGATLGALLEGRDGSAIADLLSRFESLRKNRTARIQIVSTVRFGLETRVADKLIPYLDESVPKAVTTLGERLEHDHSYDVYAACESILIR